MAQAFSQTQSTEGYSMKVALGVIVGLVIGFLAMTYFKTGHLPF
ncbi:MAG: hypothetical protein V4458_03375 [Pseudomonadota bacterium]